MDNSHNSNEPVAYGMWDTMLGKGNRMMMVRLDKGQDGCTVPLYTTPPQPEQEPQYAGTARELFTNAAIERLDVRPSTKVYLGTPAVCEQPAHQEQVWDASAPMVVHPHPAFQAPPPQPEPGGACVRCGGWVCDPVLAQPEEKVDWEKLYRLEVKKKDALAAKYERDIKPLTKIVPMAQPEQEPVAWIRPSGKAMLKTDGYCEVYASEGMSHTPTTPLYDTPPQPEPVIDKSAAVRIATSLGWEPKRTWVGLTDEELFDCLDSFEECREALCAAIEAKLKQKNGYAEEKNT